MLDSLAEVGEEGGDLRLGFGVQAGAGQTEGAEDADRSGQAGAAGSAAQQRGAPDQQDGADDAGDQWPCEAFGGDFVELQFFPDVGGGGRVEVFVGQQVFGLSFSADQIAPEQSLSEQGGLDVVLVTTVGVGREG